MYYQNLTDSKSIANLYTTNSPAYQAINRGSDLNINGAIVARPEDYERILANQRRLPFGFEKIRYVADNWDYHILNPEFNMGAPAEVLNNPKKLDRFMLTVMVSGSVFFGSDKDGLKEDVSRDVCAGAQLGDVRQEKRYRRMRCGISF